MRYKNAFRGFPRYSLSWRPCFGCGNKGIYTQLIHISETMLVKGTRIWK